MPTSIDSPRKSAGAAEIVTASYPDTVTAALSRPQCAGIDGLPPLRGDMVGTQFAVGLLAGSGVERDTHRVRGKSSKEALTARGNENRAEFSP
jgi:hypothetical protein